MAWYDDLIGGVSDLFGSGSDYVGDIASAAVDAYDPEGWGLSEGVSAAVPEVAQVTQELAPQVAASPLGEIGGWLKRVYSGDKDAGKQFQMGLGTLGLLTSLLQKQRKQPSALQMQQQLKGKFNDWTPSQRIAFDKYFYNPLPTIKQPTPQRFACGGGVVVPHMMAEGGALMSALTGEGGEEVGSGYIPDQGEGGGQDDIVPIQGAPGEYMFDADTVSALGDGNNAEGARRLDAFREQIRAHKRAAPPTEIPPKAKPPMEYLMNGGR